MVRHVALFKWAEGTTQQERDAIRTALAGLPPLIPELRAYRVGEDLGLVDGNWDFAVVADFDDVDGWSAYRNHPEHQRVIEEHIRPVLAQRASVQFRA
jgi:hypothetical protein